MVLKNNQNKRENIQSSPWIIVGSVVILLITVVVLAVQNYNREKQYMSKILTEKGAALIKAVEAGARTGMMGMMWGERQVQTLIEETALLKDVFYITIVSQDGVIMSSSKKNIIGSRLADRPYLKLLDSSDKISWKMIKTQSLQRSFEVYRYFKPISNRKNLGTNRMGQMMGTSNDWCSPWGKTVNEQIILIGLDPRPFEDARRQDIRNTVIISGVLILLGLGGFISLFWMQSYRSTQKTLQDTSAIADQIVTSLPIGLIATDKEGKIAFYNSTFENITGLDLSGTQGENPENILPGLFHKLKESLDRGEFIYEKEMECEFALDHVVPISMSASKIINEQGQFVGQVLIIRDLGEVRYLQDEIRSKEKLAAVGELAAGVAHEIRNPLSSIRGIASYFKNKFNTDKTDIEMADVMILEVDRLNRVITELLEFSRPTDLKLNTADVNSLIEHSILLIEKEAESKHIAIKADLSRDRLLAKIDSDRFTQCLLNLYLNALQAMKKGGRLSIKNFSGKDDLISIEIKDSGSGITDKDLGKIFDPYYTTKAKGTGLGLAIVNKIIQAHGGTIKVRSIPGKGTSFFINISGEKNHERLI
ncbi:MAG: ATP-binding protein [Desulfobacula sp.]|nr:ATP-binding protein [Desulfobacula sp.]